MPGSFPSLRQPRSREPMSDGQPIRLENLSSQRKTTSNLVDDALRRGATAVIGGDALDRRGYFYAPTILTDIPANAELRDFELFGPVAPITRSPARSEPCTTRTTASTGSCRHQHRPRVQPTGPFRRGQTIRLRPPVRLRRHGRIPRHHVCGCRFGLTRPRRPMTRTLMGCTGREPRTSARHLTVTRRPADWPGG